MELEADNAGITEMLEKSESRMSRILSVTMFAFVILIHYWRFFSFSFLPEKVSNSSQYRKWWWERSRSVTDLAIAVIRSEGYQEWVHSIQLVYLYYRDIWLWHFHESRNELSVEQNSHCITFLHYWGFSLDLLYLQSFNVVEIQSRMRALVNFSKSSVWRYVW